MRLVSFGDPGAERPGVLIGSDILDLRAVIAPVTDTALRLM